MARLLNIIPSLDLLSLGAERLVDDQNKPPGEAPPHGDAGLLVLDDRPVPGHQGIP